MVINKSLLIVKLLIANCYSDTTDIVQVSDACISDQCGTITNRARIMMDLTVNPSKINIDIPYLYIKCFCLFSQARQHKISCINNFVQFIFTCLFVIILFGT